MTAWSAVVGALALGALALGRPAPARAQNAEVPYWASLTASKVNMRVGPARNYNIAWVYRRDGLPLKVVRVHQGWRLVEDPDGAKGWVLARFLSRARTALVRGRVAELREEPGAGRLRWRVEPGVVGALGECRSGWCELDVGGRKGWIDADAIWGEGAP
ncbi:MAG: SH3 domain-containing protein [Novosphingobium sp.]